MSSPPSSEPTPTPAPEAPLGPPPSPLSFLTAFILVSLAWGFTTPFIRRAARTHSPPPHPFLSSARVTSLPGIVQKVLAGGFAVVDLLKNPGYAIPLVLNLTGSVWFFLLVGQAELSLTVPIVNTLAFLFTVLGEWVVEGKVIGRETAMGMVLSLCGIALCVHSKT